MRSRLTRLLFLWYIPRFDGRIIRRLLKLWGRNEMREVGIRMGWEWRSAWTGAIISRRIGNWILILILFE